MRSRSSLPAAIVFVLALGALVVYGEQIATATRGLIALPRLVQRTAPPVTWHGIVPEGGVLDIQGINGGIVARPSATGEALVTATRTGRRADPASVEIAVVPHGGGVTICALYATPDAATRDECGPGTGHQLRTRQDDVRVTFEVRVPAGIRLAARTVNGDVDASGVAGPVSLETVNGAATFSTTAYGEAKTVNGPIRAVMGTSDWTGTLRLRTVNGTITAELPRDVRTDIRARTRNGEISSGFPLGVRGPLTRRTLDASVGGGGRTLELDTVNGSIRLIRQ